MGTIALALILALQTAAPASPDPLPRPAPPYVVAPKGWKAIVYPPQSPNAAHVPVAGWLHESSVRGEESLRVGSAIGDGLNAEGAARVQARIAIGDRNGTIVASHARALCGGTIQGWELVGAEPRGPGSKTREVIFAADADRSYSVEYEREGAYPPSPAAEASMQSFCPTRVAYAPAALHGAIDAPPGWNVEDLSLRGHHAAGTSLRYLGDHQQIYVFRIGTMGGVGSDADAAVARILGGMTGNSNYTVTSKHPVGFCRGGNGWLVRETTQGPHGTYANVVAIAFASPESYVAVYTRDTRQPELPAALKAIGTLCPLDT